MDEIHSVVQPGQKPALLQELPIDDARREIDDDYDMTSAASDNEEQPVGPNMVNEEGNPELHLSPLTWDLKEDGFLREDSIRRNRWFLEVKMQRGKYNC